MKIIASQKGFTLTELVVGMAIMTTIMAAIGGVFSVSLKTYQYGFSQERVYNEGRKTINTITTELRYATVTSPIANDTTAYPQITYTDKFGLSKNITSSTNTITLNSTNYAQGMVQSVSFQRDPTALNKININMNLSYTYQGMTKNITFTTSVLTATKF